MVGFFMPNATCNHLLFFKFLHSVHFQPTLGSHDRSYLRLGTSKLKFVKRLWKFVILTKFLWLLFSFLAHLKLIKTWDYFFWQKSSFFSHFTQIIESWNIFLQRQWEAGSMKPGWHATILTTLWFWVQGSSRMISTCRLVYHYTWRDNFCFLQIEWILVGIILQICGGLGHSHRMSGITLLSVNDSKEFKKWNALSLPSVYRQEYVCVKFLDSKWHQLLYFYCFLL